MPCRLLRIVLASQLLLVPSLAHPVGAQGNGPTEESVAAMMAFATARDRVAAQEEKRWHAAAKEGATRGLEALNKKKNHELSDIYWREKDVYTEAAAIAARERDLLRDMREATAVLVEDPVKRFPAQSYFDAQLRLKNAVDHVTRFPVTYIAGRAAPDVEAVMRLDAARRNKAAGDLITAMQLEVDAHRDIEFARAQQRLTIEHYLAGLGKPDLTATFKRKLAERDAANAAWRAREEKLERDTALFVTYFFGIQVGAKVAAAMAAANATPEQIKAWKKELEDYNFSVESRCVGPGVYPVRGGPFGVSYCQRVY